MMPMTLVILFGGDRGFNLSTRPSQQGHGKVYSMSTATGTDWTHILSDPDLVRHVGKLLQAYREAPPDKREAALLEAMREIKASGPSGAKDDSSSPAAVEATP